MFRCAYHGWTYRNNGDLASITYQDRYEALFQKEITGCARRHVWASTVDLSLAA